MTRQLPIQECTRQLTFERLSKAPIRKALAEVYTMALEEQHRFFNWLYGEEFRVTNGGYGGVRRFR